MAADKYFVIGIGGTGMRCIEAFTHLCAIGMLDNKEIDILSIDTDNNNGNKGRAEQLIDRYIRIKGGSEAKPTANSFFTAKLNLFRYSPEYSGNRLTYELISGLRTGGEDIKRQNQALSDLLFDNEVQRFELNHGYRAQTHLGSELMYHGLLEAARNVRDGRGNRQEKDFAEFLNRIFEAGENARVFILGSIFGGTGASAIPIIPKALSDALKIKDKNLEIHPNAKFGCTLLSDYFSFNVPEGAQKREEKVIADSNNFARNSQAALMFYHDDDTVNRTYRVMYHIGWPSRTNLSAGQAGTKTVTGGGEQQNPAHVTELLCACAALDFFTRTDGFDQRDIVFRSADYQNGSFLFEFQDFLGLEKSKEFMNKLGAFYAFAFIIINRELGWKENGTENLAKKFKEFGSPDYVNLPSDDAKDIDEYLKSFAFTFSSAGSVVVPGWLFQVRQSVEGPFLFDVDAFSTNSKQLQQFPFGKLFTDEAYQFKGPLLAGRDPYQPFRDTIQKDPSVKPSAERQKVERLNERFLAHNYNTLTKLFKILNV